MKLAIRQRSIIMTPADGVQGYTVGVLRDDVDPAAAATELRRINREVIAPLHGTHGAVAKRREAAREAVAHLLRKAHYVVLIGHAARILCSGQDAVRSTGRFTGRWRDEHDY